MELYVISWNCIQAYVNECKFMELQVSSWNCMPAYGPACKFMDGMQASVTACKLLELYALVMELNASSCNALETCAYPSNAERS